VRVRLPKLSKTIDGLTPICCKTAIVFIPYHLIEKGRTDLIRISKHLSVNDHSLLIQDSNKIIY